MNVDGSRSPSLFIASKTILAQLDRCLHAIQPVNRVQVDFEGIFIRNVIRLTKLTSMLLDILPGLGLEPPNFRLDSPAP